MNAQRPLIAVYGSSTTREGQPAYDLALALGRHLGELGADVMTGGYSGVMEACSRGAREAGARAVGVTVELFEARGPANRWVNERVHTPDLYARLQHIVAPRRRFRRRAREHRHADRAVPDLDAGERERPPACADRAARRALARAAGGAPWRRGGAGAALRVRRVHRRSRRGRAAGTGRRAGAGGIHVSRVSADPLLEWRREFPTLDHTLHFISHSLGAMPRGVEAALADYARAWRERGIRAWDEKWFGLPTEIGDVLARILDAEPGTISMHENDTTAHAIALSAVEFTKERPRLVCTAEDFPSELYLFEGLARRGVEIVRVPARDGRTIEEADLLAAIDERTALVAVSHVFFRTAQVLDLAPIVERARAVGALTLVDAYQSVGTLSFSVRALALDMLAGGSVKWLCGGPGAGYLYVRPGLREQLRPAFTGWMAHAAPFDFDAGPMRPDPGARRFWTGTPGIPSFVAARPGYEIVAAIGTEAIRAKSLRQTGRMIELADGYGMTVVSPREPARRGGSVVVNVPHADRVCAELLAADVLLDFRPGVGLRLAPHFYTTDEEVEEVMRRVKDAAARAAG